MARLNRLLGAVSLGIAVTAAVGAAVVAGEHNPVHKAPTRLADTGRVIVKFKARASVLSASTTGSASASVTGPQKAGVMGARLGMALRDGRALGERTQVMTASDQSSAALVAALQSDADVEWVQIDHRRFIQAAPNDPRYADDLPTSVTSTGPISGQWYLRAPYSETMTVNVNGTPTPKLETIASGIDIEPAWAITHGSQAIIVADVDTGITQHPDLDSKVLTGYDFIGWGVNNSVYGLKHQSSGDAIATANDGDLNDADPSDPGDWVSGTENSNSKGSFYECNDGDFPDDPPGSNVTVNSSWHGTQTASILGAATNNGTGMAGTGYDTKVVPARALGKCGGWDSDIIAAALWGGGIAVPGVPANANPARVINMSLGGVGNCASVEDGAAYVDALTALRNKGVIVVAAAGNDDGARVDVPGNCQPAASDADKTPIVIAVAAVRHSGTKVGFSDIGPEVTIAAPGGNCVNTSVTQSSQCLFPIITAVNSGATSPAANGGTYSDGVFNTSLGTSFSTPMVAGTVALMLSAAPNLSNAQVINILKTTARAFPTTSDTTPTPPVCTVPAYGSTAKQDECLCTTGTCGAGMLNAGAAVPAANALSTGTPPTAAVSPISANVASGSTTTLDGSASMIGAGSGVGTLSYHWTILDSASNVTLSSGTGSSVVVTGVSAGTARVLLTVSDSRGVSATAVSAITVPGATSSGGGGGGGGAANPAWLAALALAGLLLRARQRTRA